MRYNPPPTWPQPPAGWQPPPGWVPDPSWGPPPPGWVLWVPDDVPPAPTGGGYAPPGAGAPPVGFGGPGMPAPGPGAPSAGPGKAIALTAALVVALLVVGGGLLLYSRSGSGTPVADSPSAPTPTTTTSRGPTRTTTSTPAPTTSAGGSAAPDTLEGAFPMITGGTEACGEVPVDPVELEAGSAALPQRAVQCSFGGSPVDGTLYLAFATVADAGLFQLRPLPGSSTRTWGLTEGTEGTEVDHTSPTGVVEQELYYDGSRYVAVVRAGPGSDVEQVFQWTVSESRTAADMPG